MAVSQASIGTSIGALYTSTGTTATTCIFVCNTDSSAVTLSLYVVPSGGTPGNGNIILKDLSIPAGDTYFMNTEKVVLDNGDTIQGLAGTGSVLTSTISYVSI